MNLIRKLALVLAFAVVVPTVPALTSCGNNTTIELEMKEIDLNEIKDMVKSHTKRNNINIEKFSFQNINGVPSLNIYATENFKAIYSYEVTSTYTKKHLVQKPATAYYTIVYDLTNENINSLPTELNKEISVEDAKQQDVSYIKTMLQKYRPVQFIDTAYIEEGLSNN